MDASYQHFYRKGLLVVTGSAGCGLGLSPLTCAAAGRGVGWASWERSWGLLLLVYLEASLLALSQASRGPTGRVEFSTRTPAGPQHRGTGLSTHCRGSGQRAWCTAGSQLHTGLRLGRHSAPPRAAPGRWAPHGRSTLT